MISVRSSHLWARRLLCAGAIAWGVLIPSAAVAAGRASSAPVVGLLAALPYMVGAVICHQQAARSFAIWSQQLPVCARCTGIYAGAALVAAVSVFLITGTKVAQGFRGSPKRGTREGGSPAKTIILAALPTAATLAYEWSTSTTPSNVVRAIAGFPLGAAVAWVILSAVDDQVN